MITHVLACSYTFIKLIYEDFCVNFSQNFLICVSDANKQLAMIGVVGLIAAT